MDILDVITGIDLELLKEQGSTVESCIDLLDNEIDQGSIDPEYTERLEIDRSNLLGLLELIDNLVIGLENE